ncbi:hypothetical protein HK099_000886 [Clydaea vesicula]|uniref:Uncharacterized protein n=1 Tax=Clydaea vesicula TaxID=447962 RepID=A0AAD5TXB1_9FUNG|nr:hypothetical protein HK099_000886 [Clydaea vesicula]
MGFTGGSGSPATGGNGSPATGGNGSPSTGGNGSPSTGGNGSTAGDNRSSGNGRSNKYAKLPIKTIEFMKYPLKMHYNLMQNA